MSSNLTPLQVCERLIGRPEAISEVCGLQPKAAYAWRHPSQTRAAGDLPSTAIMRRILAWAAGRQIPLTAEHLIWGADADEIAALCAATVPERSAA